MSNSSVDRHRAKVAKTAVKQEALTCKPLDTYNDILGFLDNPPLWRTLCKELTPHSKYVLKNMDDEVTGTSESVYGITQVDPVTPVEPVPEPPVVKNYCHFPPDVDQPKRYDSTKEKIPKTLVCHDMANGYHDDSVMGGTTDYSQYTFYNWAGIDIFCYFSHHLITIPPLAWINVGHAHGVKVIGTIISEWADGVTFWDKVLSSTTEYQNFVRAVVTIAKTLKFDGYLLNIENKVTQPEVLLEFVKHLHEMLHKELNDPVLIWYDSVTITGKLLWQNELNDKNVDFFHACDGFFTNYSWSVDDVSRSAKMAGDRVTDVYIGIDVWGRNFYGGGQFNTQEAVKIVHKEGCSLAIFAPAWSHESWNKDPTDQNCVLNASSLNKLEQFMLRDRALWGSLWPYLHTRVPCSLPFQTSFCRGQGKRRWIYGEVISPGPWYNLRHQQYQPNASHGQHGFRFEPAKAVRKPIKSTSNNSYVADEKKKKGIMKTASTISDDEDNVSRDDSMRSRTGSEIIELITPCSTSEQYVEEEKKKKGIMKPTPNIANGEGTPSKDEGTRSRTGSEIIELTPCSTPEQVSPKKGFFQRFKRFFGRLSFSGQKSQPNNDSANEFSNKIKEAPIKEAVVPPFTERSSSIAGLDPKPPREPRTRKPTILDPVLLHGASSSGERAPLAARDPSMVLKTTSVNLNLVTMQIKTRWDLKFQPRERECLQVYLQDGFNGGSSLRVNPSDEMSCEHRLTRLLHCDFECQKELIICVVTKRMQQYPDQSLNIILMMENTDHKELEVILLGRNLGLSSTVDEHTAGISCIYPVYSSEQAKFQDLRRYLLMHQPEFYVPIENHFGWEVRYYTLEVPGSRILSFNCRTVLTTGGILLGHLGVCNRHDS